MNHQEEYISDCRKLAARTALQNSANLAPKQAVMLYHGLASMFPYGSAEHIEAREAALALEAAEKRQLKLTHLLES